MTAKDLEQWKRKLKKLSNQREKNINRYIIPIELKMEKIISKIREVEPDYNEY